MKYLALILFAMLLTGCYSTGAPIDTAKANQFVKGETTESEVIAALGKPTTITTNDLGEKQISYLHTDADVDAATYIPIVGIFAGGATGTAKTLTVSFDNKGIVKDWSMSESVVRSEL